MKILKKLRNILRWYLLPWKRPKLSTQGYNFTGAKKIIVHNLNDNTVKVLDNEKDQE